MFRRLQFKLFQKSFQNLSPSCISMELSTIAVLQLNCNHDIEENWKTIHGLINKSKALVPNVKMIFLPECFDYVARNKEESVQNAITEDGEYLKRYRNLAKELDVWFSLGGFHEKIENENRVHNAHLIIDPSGQTVAKYRKLHLFDLEIPNKIRVKETDFTKPGSEIVPPVVTPIGNVGLSTCYDLRFPHLNSILRNSGAEILTYPSAFTVTTGMDHWEVLLRSTAITTQCYVVAAAQTGKHNDKRASFGHAMVVDPWGAVVAQCSEGQKMCFAQIDLNYLKNVRQNLPCFDHRRLDLYGCPTLTPKFLDPDGWENYTFGHCTIPPAHVFLRSSLSYAFVNRKPILLGHTLVVPFRKVDKVTDLTQPELADLFRCVQMVERELEKFYNVSSSTVCIQDGPEAGQSIKHVHVHIIPRRPGDFGDKIYPALEKHDKVESGFRSPEEMSEEAKQFRKLFSYV